MSFIEFTDDYSVVSLHKALDKYLEESKELPTTREKVIVTNAVQVLALALGESTPHILNTLFNQISMSASTALQEKARYDQELYLEHITKK